MKAISKQIDVRNFILSFLSLYFIFDIITSLSNLIMGNMAEQQLVLSDINFSFKCFYIMQSFIESIILSFIMTITFKCRNIRMLSIEGLTMNDIINKLPSYKYEKQSDKHLVIYKNEVRRYYFGEIHLVRNDNGWHAIGAKPQIKKIQDLFQ